MSTDLTTKSTLFHKNTMKSALSQSDNQPYTRHSLKNHQLRSQSMNRTATSTEEISGDILTDLSSLPYMTSKQVNHKRDRRFSELKPSHMQQIQNANSERRNSTSQINFSALLPKPFRSNKHHRNTTKDETNTATNTSNSTSSLHHNDMMTTKTELPSSLKLSNTTINGSRTNLSTSNDRLSSLAQDDSRSSSISFGSSQFILALNQSAEPRSAETLKLELRTALCVGHIYREHFFEYFHTNYYGEFEQEGPFIASLRYVYTKPTTSDNTSSITDANTYCQARAIIRTPSRNDVVSVMVDGTNEDNILQILFNQAHLSAIHTCKTIGDPKANEKIHSFDRLNDERQNCKIGLIYQRADQTIEYDIYSNDHLSIDLLDFLQILADRVRLKGFHKYRGDLDIKDDLHGEYSYYTQYRNHEIMFNIASIIPSTKANGQCIERKGLVGNSFVCIVFQEPNAEFSPDFLSGKVTQIYITVQPNKIDEKIYYKIGIWHRSDITNIIDPPSGIYQCDNSFRDYFLTLLLNLINVAIESPSLRGRVAEQRQRLKREELKKLSQSLCVGQILNLTTDHEQINCHVDQHSNSRQNSSFSTATPSTTDTISRPPVAIQKKGSISKILSVFGGGRSTSIPFATSAPSASIPPNLPNHDVSPVSPPSPEINTTQSNTALPPAKEPIKRTLSAKRRPAPPPPPAPPIPPRIPIAKTQSIPSIPSPASLHSTISDSLGSTNDTVSSLSFLNTTASEEPVARNRSNSTPGNSINMSNKLQSSTVSSISEENDNTDSIVDADFDDEFSEDEKIEHRRTLTESPLLLPSTTTS